MSYKTQIRWQWRWWEFRRWSWENQYSVHDRSVFYIRGPICICRWHCR